MGLQETSLELAGGHLVGLIGPNGAGKSSLLKAVAGVIPHEGAVAWQDRPLGRMHRLERARTVSYLPQTAAAHWSMKVRELVALGRLPHLAFGERPSAADGAAVEQALEQCEADALAERTFDELSGGERARVLLARALAVAAPVLLVDEPVQYLDPYHQLKIMIMLRGYARAGTLVLAVLHDVALAARFCTRLVLLSDGRVMGDGGTDDVLARGVIERWYRVEPFLSRHRDQPVVLPWLPIDSDRQ